MSFINGVCASGRLLVNIAVSGDGKEYHRLAAKIDTGATITAMSASVLDKVKCPWRDRRAISTAGGYIEADVFDAFIGLPVGGKIVQKRRTKITALPFRIGDFDILLGMDILEQCCFVCCGGAFFLGFDGADDATKKAAIAFLGK